MFLSRSGVGGFGTGISGTIDGGPGLNTCKHSLNVTVVNCQNDLSPLVKAPPLGGGLGHVVHF
jgi:hypothetical protein